MTDERQEHTGSFSSDAVRLSIREWLGLLLALTVLALFAEPIWTRIEVFEASPDYRIPYNSSEDYWLFDRYCTGAEESEKTLVIGDSFVWGQYVGRDETLSHFLNREAGSERFVNAGVDGTHPLALEGLIKNYCANLRNREVILHLNLLWLSSPQADLQLERGLGINHPRLVPQFVPTIPSYDASTSERLGIVLARHLPILDWSRHIQISYFSNADLPHWTLENPYLNPLRQVTLSLPESASASRPETQAWFSEGAVRQELPWVDVETSQQWRAFRRLVRDLQTHGTRLFVLVGPLNEHMLEPSSLAAYKGILAHVESWLRDNDQPYYAPPVLPSELYADLSHPLGPGYSLLAQVLWGHLSG
jgi:hypothetical protein